MKQPYSKLSRKIRFCYTFIIVMLLVATLTQPIIGFSEEKAETTEEMVTETEPIENVEETQTEINLDFEEQANSWRFKDGQLIENGYSNDNRTKARAAFIPWSEVNGQFISSDGSVIPNAIRKGIDVSEFQGKIDWSKVKASGIDFAIIRCGYGSNYTSQDDARWEYNVSECERLGIPYGVYLYSYANNTTKARSEAQHVLRLLQGHNPSYPIYYDLEDDIVSAAGNSNIVNFANIFCSTIEASGYEAGIYANLNWWNNKLNSSTLDKYDKWVAQWNNKCTYTGSYRLWQCTSNGTVSGINGRVDLNFEFPTADSVIDVADYKVVVASEYRNCRTGPGTGYEANGKIYAGEEVTITEECNGWGKIGDSKWIAKSGISRVTDVSDYKVVVSSDYRNCRKGPSTSVDGNGKIYVGDEVTITEECDGWGKIGDSKWIAKSGISRVTNVSDYKVVVSSDYRNCRKGPSTSVEGNGKIYVGDEVMITEECDGWGKIGDSKWIAKSGISRVTNVSDYDVVVTTDYRNCRKAPGTKMPFVKRIYKGSELTITEEADGWGKIGNKNWIAISGVEKIK